MTKKEIIRELKDFNAHLRNEVHELKDKLKEAEKKSAGYFQDMIEIRLDNYDLLCKIDRLQAENDKLKSQKGSIFTGPSEKELRLERQLDSALERVDELIERNETLQTRYDEAEQAVKELTDEKNALNDQVESLRHDLYTRFETTKMEGTDNDSHS